eukprot:5978756-Alexandrium_andersonii.AAC.2
MCIRDRPPPPGFAERPPTDGLLPRPGKSGRSPRGEPLGGRSHRPCSISARCKPSGRAPRSGPDRSAGSTP